jgi:chemotaxis protein methyltransferase CheR
MEPLLYEQFRRQIADHMGMHIREQERALLKKTLASRIQTLKCESAEEYYELLQRGNEQSEAEWKQLAILLTNQESYFFRDQGQFDTLRNHILPALIQRNQKEHRLRIWSAGCSTGQEPYSIAILLDRLLPLRDRWDITILGTDVSEAALEKARRGLYNAWSLRALEPQLQQQYFARRQNEFELDARIRQIVTFQHGNLLRDTFPSQISGLCQIDLIVCRNVFIYFERDIVGKVLRKFSETLSEDGYLLTGHAELHDAPLGKLQPRNFPGTVIYQKVVSPKRAAAPTPVFDVASTKAKPRGLSHAGPVPQRKSTLTQPIKAPAAAVTSKLKSTSSNEDWIAEVLALLKAGRHAQALEKLQPFLDPTTSSAKFEACCLAAQAHANAGRYDEAEEYCQRATAIDGLEPLPLHIMARLSEERGDRERAKVLLKKVCYLAPGDILACVELSTIYDHEGDVSRARKLRATALEMLEQLAPQQPVPLHALSADKSTSARELRQYLQEV